MTREESIRFLDNYIERLNNMTPEELSIERKEFDEYISQNSYSNDSDFEIYLPGEALEEYMHYSPDMDENFSFYNDSMYVYASAEYVISEAVLTAA